MIDCYLIGFLSLYAQYLQNLGMKTYEVSILISRRNGDNNEFFLTARKGLGF